ncbi:sensor histidine kinase [Nesterenkonia sp. F]|uniref:sensor histidine kinase n=1 Tax=Nesterenkonia sp. F TaxID=795955 RepID=UPI000255D104|nr:sensor histidine kinase [Nesterenkonia sp. F]
MVTLRPADGPVSMLRRLTRDAAYVLPGLPIAIFGFSLLVSLFALSLATSVLWIGALLLPATLILASGFAELSRRRLRVWGAAPAPVRYRPRTAGVAGLVRLIGDPRRWLDLVFEAVIALPVRLATFAVALIWIVGAPAELTYFLWSLLVPGERGLIALLEVVQPALVPVGDLARYAVDSGAHFLLGVVLLVTLPMVLRGLAVFDAALATSLLGSGGRGRPRPPEPGEVDDPEGAGDVDADDGHGGRRSAAAVEEAQASFSAAAWSWIGTSFSAVVLLAVGWPLTSVLYEVPAAIAMVLVLLHCAALLLTLRHAWAGLAVGLLASAAMMSATASAGVVVWPWPVTTMITQSAVLLVAALTRRWFCAAGGWAAGALLTAGTMLAVAPELPVGSVSTSTVFVAVSAAVVVLGILTHQWILDAGRLEVSERTSAQQTRRRRELEERNRIARELHDVVAHSMSVVSVQASTAPYRLPSLDEEARGEFAEIARSSRRALSEMRMLLGILRGEDDAPTGPAPGVEEIGELVESTRASGATIAVRGVEELPEIPSAVGIAAYRLVQEALSNALRHAPGARIDVAASVDNGDGGAAGRSLRIEVSNTAPGGDAAASPGAGMGLHGIRERVGAVGGSVEAGPSDDGGFAVRASLPLEQE